MLVGLPGSGKSTYAKYISKALKNAVIHSSDSIRHELYGAETEQKDPVKVFCLLRKRVIIDLKIGKDVIYDATNIKSEDRKNAIKAIKTQVPSVEIIALIMDTDVNRCKENNALRNRQVPNWVYEKMVAEYSLPSLDEGFDQILTVRLKKNNDFLLDSTTANEKRDIKTIAYDGVFFDKDSLYDLIEEKFGKNRLYHCVANPHVTFQYKPQIIRDDLFGEKVEFQIVGYGNDGLNEGLRVEWLSGSAKVKKLFDTVSIPHITLSFGQFGSAVNTRYLDFKPIKPFVISGIFGGLTK